MARQGANNRHYTMSSAERVRRHIRDKGSKATISAVSITGVLAGFLSAAGIVWPLLAYIGLIVILMPVSLSALALPGRPLQYLMLLLAPGPRPEIEGRPLQLENLMPPTRIAHRLVRTNRCDDPVYGGGFRSMLGRADPIVVIPSNRRDVGKPHELLYPLFVKGGFRSHIEVDLRPAGIPLPPFKFERELPEGAQESDHSMAIKDIIYVSDLLLSLRDAGARIGVPAVWPEHCVDPLFLAMKDVIVIGGPDTNFWHAALFEAVNAEFDHPESSVPLAMSLRDDRKGYPVYGSRSLLVKLSYPAELPRTDDGRVELDERILPTYGMILACRNPFAAALGVSRWCVFLAGVRSLGTSGAVLGLATMLQAMRRDPELNFWSAVPTSRSGVNAQVTAILCRVSEVEQAAIRRDGKVVSRMRCRLNSVGLDPMYSDTYIPTEIEYLSYVGEQSSWKILCRLSATGQG